MAALAREESRAKSDAAKFGINRSMKGGNVKLNYSQFLGYAKDNDGNLVIVAEESVIVKKMAMF